MTSKSIHQFTATCSGGMETLLSSELATFGASDIASGRNFVSFSGSLSCGYTACLWSRFASRILFKVCDFDCQNEDDLYQFSLGFDWTAHMDVQTTFAIGISLGDTKIGHSRFAALRVKDGIVDFFRDRTGARPSVQTQKPDLRFHVHIHGGKGTLSIDFSGESLHRRGYRVDSGTAPLKESLAAAIVSLAGFDQESEANVSFVDPMCGSATLLIEAALIFGDSAPGLTRNYFGFIGWKAHNKTLWSKLIDEAVSREEAGLDKQWPPFIGYDADPLVVSAARQNLEKAGLTDKIQVKQAQLYTLHKPSTHGFLVTNPPYGERLLDKMEVAGLYSFLGHRLKSEFNGWNISIFISNPDLGDKLQLPIQSRHRLFNGPISCLLLRAKIETVQTDLPFPWNVSTKAIEGEGAPFSNRLRKNLKAVLKWARRENIQCFRVYDRDLPDFNLSIDLYDKWVHVREYMPAKSVDKGLAAERFRLALACIRELLNVPRSNVFIMKSIYQRDVKRENNRIQKQKKKEIMKEVREGDCRFLVSLTNSFDTGLGLEERNIRAKISAYAKGKRFLSLFSQSGTATVCAAVGGAASTTSIDPFVGNRNWCRQNLGLNGFSHNFHETITCDCLHWLKKADRTYDLIVINPPTSSKITKEKKLFTLQRDHVQLITLAMNRLSSDGLLIFFINQRTFKLDPSLKKKFSIIDISSETTPGDFKRRPTLGCWEFRLISQATP